MRFFVEDIATMILFFQRCIWIWASYCDTRGVPYDTRELLDFGRFGENISSYCGICTVVGTVEKKLRCLSEKMKRRHLRSTKESSLWRILTSALSCVVVVREATYDTPEYRTNYYTLMTGASPKTPREKVQGGGCVHFISSLSCHTQYEIICFSSGE